MQNPDNYIDERMIVGVDKDSPGYLSGIREGDIVIEVDGNKIHDSLDWAFFVGGEEPVEIIVERDGFECAVELEPFDGDTGLNLAPLRVRKCGNKCIFCFIDQLPNGLRKSLYIKDGDFRFSFLHGSYITMTNLSDDDWERIIEQRMTPLYISVHSTDENVREQMLGRNNIPIIKQLQRLAKSGIQFHTQIVLIPGFNDSVVLDRTIHELLEFGDSLLSLAIVPVGSTKHRKGLPHLEKVSPELAKTIIDLHRSFKSKISVELSGKIQLADEFFIIAGERIPPQSYYRDYPQYENGVGMVRDFMECLNRWRAEEFPDLKGAEIAVVTGELFAPLFAMEAKDKLEQLANCRIQVIAADNNLFGREVTVANLLSGLDIVRAYRKFDRTPDALILPPRIVNSDNRFLDGITLDELRAGFDIPVILAPDNPTEIGKVFYRVLHTRNR